MKIITMISGGDIGGAKTHVLSLLAGLHRSETIHLICFTEGDFAAEARQLQIPTTVLEGNNLFATRRQILAMIRREGYQVIHCHGARANMMGALLRKKAGIPVISTIHSDYRLDYLGRPLAALTYGRINQRALPKFDAWVGVSHGMTQLLTTRGFDPQRIFTLYNGVDFSSPRPVQPRADYLASLGLELPEDGVLFGIAARINPVKDMSTLVRAFAQAVQRCPRIRLAIAGDGEEAETIRALARQLCPEGTVHFAGWVRDIDSFYNALDVNLLTSLSETFPYALTEGARMGCATISSRVGGVPWLIDHGENGLLFEPRDADTLARHMELLATDHDLRRRMGQALQEKTRREFSLETMIARQKHIYEVILRRAARPRDRRDGVMICGAYGKGNSGDNAILSAIVEQLRSIDPDLPICALSRDPAETRLCAGIDAVYTFSIFRIGRRMRRTRLYLSGGGTLMQDATSTRSLLYYLFSIRQAARNGCRVMLYGCGIGPIHRERNRRRAARILNRYAQVISVRDDYSGRELELLQVTRPQIHRTADPALLIDPKNSQQLGRQLRQWGLSPEARYLMLSVRPWPGFEEALPHIAAAVDHAAEAYGLRPLLFAMEPSRDHAAAQKVAQLLRSPHLLLDAGIDGEATIGLVQRMELVISMRLHTLIFAAGQAVPMVGLVYDPKVSAFLDYLGQDCYLPLESLDRESLCGLIDRAMAERGGRGERVQRLRHLAGENGRLARQLLQGPAPKK